MRRWTSRRCAVTSASPPGSHPTFSPRPRRWPSASTPAHRTVPTSLSSPSIRPARATSIRPCTSPDTARATWSATRSRMLRPTSRLVLRWTTRPGVAARPFTFPTCACRCTQPCSAKARPACCPTRSAPPCCGRSPSTPPAGPSTSSSAGRGCAARPKSTTPACSRCSTPAPRRTRPRCYPPSGGFGSDWPGHGMRSTSTCPSRRSCPTRSGAGSCSGGHRCRSRAGTRRSAC